MFALWRPQTALVINLVVLMEANMITVTLQAAECFSRFVPPEGANLEADKLLFNCVNNAGCLQTFQLKAL